MEVNMEVIDLRGAGCASVLIRLAAEAKSDQKTRTVVVWTDDLGAPEELPAWCRMTGHRFIGPVADQPSQYLLMLHPQPFS